MMPDNEALLLLSTAAHGPEVQKMVRLRSRIFRLALALLALWPQDLSAAPDELRLGKASGYPIGNGRNWAQDESVRVGSFSHLDQILPHNVLKKSAAPSTFKMATKTGRITYKFDNKTYTIEDFLAHQRITGLMIIKDDRILAERYQYDRNAQHRLLSHSMAKSIVSIAVGIAMAEKKIRSLDDKAETYEPRLAGSAYGQSSIRSLLRMASGVKFREVYDNNDDLARLSAKRYEEGTIPALRSFNERETKEGSRFKYSSAETVALVAVLRAATGASLSDYLTERLWQPMGAESDATWATVRSDGYENGGGRFNAVLRDYGRLGRLLAGDGAINGRQIIPKAYLIQATDWRRQPDAFQPRKATPYFGYGYQFWTYPGNKRRFALLGVYGQSIFIDPETKLVMVITAVTRNASTANDSLARERDALWRSLVGRFSSW
jgi:CubicO group peptidase (beta-lactamase class C family)